MSGFDLYVPNTERWRGVFKKTGVPVKDGIRLGVQTGGRDSSVKLVTPSQQMINAAASELKSALRHDEDGILHSESPPKKATTKKVKPAGAKKRTSRKQVRSAPAKKKPAGAAKAKSTAKSPSKKPVAQKKKAAAKKK